MINIVERESYDFFLVEPRQDDIKISFRKDKVEKETKYIKVPIYSSIIVKAKSVTGLQVEDTKAEQEGTGELPILKVSEIVKNPNIGNAKTMLF